MSAPATLPAGPGPLTPQQLLVLRVVAECIDATDLSPTITELVAETGISRSNLHRLLALLEDKGWLARHAGQWRGLVLLHRPPGAAPEEPVFTLSADTLPPLLAAELTLACERYGAWPA